MSKKNILIVANSGLGKTGVPNVIFQVVRCLSKVASIDLVVFNDEDYYKKKIEECGARIIKATINEPSNRLMRFMWHLFREKKAYKKIFSLYFKRKKYDVVHSFKEYDSAYIFKVAHKFGISERIIHCNNEISKPKNLISLLFFKNKIKIIRKYVTKLIGVSTRCCSVSYPNIKYFLLFNSFDKTKFQNVDDKHDPNKLVLTQIATFSSRKNQLFSLDVLKEILNKRDAQLFLIGTEVECGYTAKIIDQIKLLNLEDNVTIIDGSQEFTKVLEKTSYLILPSISEGAPIVLIESQFCGITCFASSNIVSDVDCGGVVFVEGFDKKIWANKIINTFDTYGGSRNNFDTSRFSQATFDKTLLKIYGF